MQFVDFALGEGNELDAREGELLVKAGDVLKIAAQTIKPLGKDDIEGFRPSILKELLVPGSERGGSTYGMVGVGADKRPAFLFNVSLADPDLIRDRRFALIVRAVPRVDGGALGVSTPSVLHDVGLRTVVRVVEQWRRPSGERPRRTEQLCSFAGWFQRTHGPTGPGRS